MKLKWWKTLEMIAATVGGGALAAAAQAAATGDTDPAKLKGAAIGGAIAAGSGLAKQWGGSKPPE